jgi:hypothetical protein
MSSLNLNELYLELVLVILYKTDGISDSFSETISIVTTRNKGIVGSK